MPHDPTTAILARIGAVVAVALLLALVADLFVGSLAFAVLLTALTVHTARSRATAAAAVAEPAPDAEPATPPLRPSTAAGALARS